MFIQEAVDKYNIDPDLTRVTVDDASAGTHLMVQYQGQTWCLRDTGRMTLYTSAGQIGPANGNMVKAEAYSDLAKSMNLGLKYAKGNALLLIRYGKLSALHSGASDGYCVMPISELLAATKNALNKRFGVPQFKEGSNSHSYTSAIWELPDVQSELVNKYQQALHGRQPESQRQLDAHGSLFYKRYCDQQRCPDAEAEAEFRRVCLLYRQGHPGRAHDENLRAVYGLEKFQQEAENLYALFEDGAELMKKLGEVEIANPVNCLVGICAAPEDSP